MRALCSMGALAAAAVAASFALSPPSPAAYVSTVAVLPFTPSAIDTDLVIDRFNPRLGKLERISLCFNCGANRRVAAENLSNAAAPISFEQIIDDFRVALPGQDADVNPLFVLQTGIDPFVTATGAFDGSLDFGGSSGFDTGFILQTVAGEWETTDPRMLALFTGTGTTTLHAVARGSTQVNGPSNMHAVSASNVAMRLSIFYGYAPVSQ